MSIGHCHYHRGRIITRCCAFNALLSLVLPVKSAFLHVLCHYDFGNKKEMSNTAHVSQYAEAKVL